MAIISRHIITLHPSKVNWELCIIAEIGIQFASLAFLVLIWQHICCKAKAHQAVAYSITQLLFQPVWSASVSGGYRYQKGNDWRKYVNAAPGERVPDKVVPYEQ